MNLELISAGHEEASDAAGLDASHRKLFDLYNRITWARHHEAAVVPIRERIRTFVMYALWHFAFEEQRMRELHYRDRASHKAIMSASSRMPRTRGLWRELDVRIDACGY